MKNSLKNAERNVDELKKEKKGLLSKCSDLESKASQQQKEIAKITN